MGTQLRALSESYPINTNMAGFRRFFKNISVLVLGMKLVPALKGLNREKRLFDIHLIKNDDVTSFPR